MKKAELSIQTVIATILLLITLVVIIIIFREHFSAAFSGISDYLKQAIGLSESIDTTASLGD